MKITLPFLVLFILAFVPIRAEINPIEDIIPQHPAHIVSGNIFKIFPNPVKEYFYVSDNGDVAYIFLYNIMGKKVKEFTKAPPRRILHRIRCTHRRISRSASQSKRRSTLYPTHQKQ
jgi:hypothetical protein